MIEYWPWRGAEYDLGINGQRIAVVGYSHHHSDGRDYEGLTEEIVGKILSGEWTFSFFTSIRKYFSFDSNSDFWNRVLFFNYLPGCIGTSEHRYDDGTLEQIERAQVRFFEIIKRERPHKVFVFTKKGWDEFPGTREEKSNEGLHNLSPRFPDFTWRTYDAGGPLVMAFGLRHPQGAKRKPLQDAVKYIMAMPPLNSQLQT